MRIVVTLCALLMMSGTSLADTNATRLKIENGRIVVAQSYCAMCSDARTSCTINCNGAGTCIQNCDYDYRTCVEQNCRYRR